MIPSLHNRLGVENQDSGKGFLFGAPPQPSGRRKTKVWGRNLFGTSLEGSASQPSGPRKSKNARPWGWCVVSTEEDPLLNHPECKKQNAARFLKTRRQTALEGRVPSIDHDSLQFSTIGNQQIKWIETPFFQSLIQKFSDLRCRNSCAVMDLKKSEKLVLKKHRWMAGKEHRPTVEVP